MKTDVVGRYARLFPFREFNKIQERAYGSVFECDDNLVISAPTGSGKVVMDG